MLTVSDGHEAWEVLADILRSPDFKDIARHYQLILTDIEMPRMDGAGIDPEGQSVLPRLRNFPAPSFSGSSIDGLAERCRAVGADAVITKDDIELLIRSLDSKVIRQMTQRFIPPKASERRRYVRLEQQHMPRHEKYVFGMTGSGVCQRLPEGREEGTIKNYSLGGALRVPRSNTMSGIP